MKKFFILIIISFVLLGSCANNSIQPEVTEIWREVYADFLREPNNYDMLIDEYSGEPLTLFGLRDLDNNGIPELILLDLMPVSDETFNKCVIYAYADDTVKLIGSEWLRYGSVMLSDNPDFPGLFTTNGSSAFQDCYLTINNGEFEIIRITDYNNDSYFIINDIDEALKNEWIKLGGDDFLIMEPTESVSLLNAYKINEENISEIILRK